MIQHEEGVLERTNICIDVNGAVMFLIMTPVFVMEFNPVFRENNLLRYMFILLLAFTTLANVFSYGIPAVSAYYKWGIAVLFMYSASRVWTISSNNTIAMLKNVVLSLGINFMLFYYITSKEKLMRVMKSACVAIMINCIFILSNIKFSQLGTVRIGSDYAALKLWNANEIGHMSAYGFILLYYFLTATYGFKRIICLMAMGCCAFVTLFTGSRTALILVVVFLMLFFRSRDNRLLKRCLNILIALFILAVLAFVLMNNEQLYFIIGRRIENLVLSLVGKSVYRENSIGFRKSMIVNGIYWFIQNPIIGYGLDSYRTLYFRKYGIPYYAHNNFIEMMVDVGAIGFFIYYRFYLYIVRRLAIRSDDPKKAHMAIFFFSVIISESICEMGMISYYQFIYQFIIMLCYSCVYLSQAENDTAVRNR